jgi:DNA-binding response OmpR family regulator
MANEAEARVLLIEDELRTAQFVSTGLELDGHEVVIAEDGDVGLFLAATEPFDLFVLDLAAPGASGLEILGRIRSSAGRDVPVIVLSEHDDRITRRACEDAGASAFVAKPLMVERLRERVKEQLARHRARAGNV